MNLKEIKLYRWYSKKYNIKIDNNSNNDDTLNDEDLGLDEENEEKKILKEQERIKK